MTDQSEFDVDKFLAACAVKHKRAGTYLRHPHERDSPVQPVDNPRIRQAWTVYLVRMAEYEQRKRQRSEWFDQTHFMTGPCDGQSLALPASMPGQTSERGDGNG